ncbi:MAG: ribosome maturation factor RimP [Candidatus Midichloriaceae bacterium]|jgi:ribosome maturation factor RimP
MINVFNTQTEEKIYYGLFELISELAYNIVRVRINKNKKVRKCQIMIERSDGEGITLNDCQIVNKLLMSVLKESFVELVDFNIEVSSSGLNKPLTRISDFEKNIGKTVKIHSLFKINNRKIFTGVLLSATSENIKIKLKDSSDEIEISVSSISESYLQYQFN